MSVPPGALPAEAQAPPIPGRLPLLYFGFAHLCLASALTAVMLSPGSFAGYFYHPRALAAVHLVTLGWVTSHILGSLYMIAPMALRTRLRSGRADAVGFWCFAIGVAGMASHFWIGETVGMLGSALLVMAALALVAARTAAALRRSPIPAGVKLHFRLAFANILAAGTLGMLLGLHRVRPFLRSEPLAGLFAHAHLAALGWATMTLLGAAQRLLPMMLPSSTPPPATAWMSAVLLETGVLGIVVCLVAGSGPLALFAAVAVAGLAWFVGLAGWMLRHRQRPGPGLPRFDTTRVFALQSLLYLVLTAGLGCWLAVAPRSVGTLRLAPAYAVSGLLGFLGSMILGVAGRHVPVLLWTRRLRQSGTPPAHSPYRLRPRAVEIVELTTWSLGTPLLALAFWLEAAPALAAAAALLLTAVVSSASGHLRALREAGRGAPAAAPAPPASGRPVRSHGSDGS